LERKKLLALLVSFTLVLALGLSACTQQASPTTPAGSTGGATDVYNVLNPQGIYVPVQTVGLAPRLSTLGGKTILYYQSEANPVMMPVLLPRLQQDYPTATFTAIYTESFGLNTPGDEIKGIDAVIRGVSW
jgi:hypothetical protein